MTRQDIEGAVEVTNNNMHWIAGQERRQATLSLIQVAKAYLDLETWVDTGLKDEFHQETMPEMWHAWVKIKEEMDRLLNPTPQSNLQQLRDYIAKTFRDSCTTALILAKIDQLAKERE